MLKIPWLFYAIICWRVKSMKFIVEEVSELKIALEMNNKNKYNGKKKLPEL